jgi:DnaJ-class molecular chaperone
LEKAEKDTQYCSTASLQEKAGSYIRNFKASLAEATKARDDYRKYLAKIDAMSGSYLQALQQEKADRMKVCHRCNGRGQLFKEETNTTKFVPSFEYRNSMKIETRTSITTTRQRWVGVCPVCKGEGYIDPHEH